MCFHLASCACFVFCHFPSRIESAGHIWGMRGQSCARRHHLGLETVCHSGPSPSRSQTPRYCRLRHGNMDIHIPAACPKVFLRSVACSLVHGYLAFRWPVGFPCLGLWCGRGVCASVCVLFCFLLDLLLRFFGSSHFLRFLLAVYVLFAGSPCVLLARLLQLLPLWSCGVFVSAWHAYVVWRASRVCICYMSLYRAAPDVFFLQSEKCVSKRRVLQTEHVQFPCRWQAVHTRYHMASPPGITWHHHQMAPHFDNLKMDIQCTHGLWGRRHGR